MVDIKIAEIIKSYDLYDLFDGHVCSVKDDFKKEISENYVTINFSKNDAVNYSTNEIITIIEMIIENKKKYIESNNLPRMLFYLWYAEQSMCLSYCVISDITGRKLPFSREVFIVDDMSLVIEKFLFGCREDAVLLLSDCEIINQDEVDREVMVQPLQVFVKAIGGRT